MIHSVFRFKAWCRLFVCAMQEYIQYMNSPVNAPYLRLCKLICSNAQWRIFFAVSRDSYRLIRRENLKMQLLLSLIYWCSIMAVVETTIPKTRTLSFSLYYFIICINKNTKCIHNGSSTWSWGFDAPQGVTDFVLVLFRSLCKYRRKMTFLINYSLRSYRY